MFIDINKIQDVPVQFERQLDLTEFAGDPAQQLSIKKSALNGEVMRTERGVLLKARIAAEIEIGCVRCLEPFELTISEDFSLVLVSQEAAGGPGEAELTRADLALYHAAEGRADLRSIAREQIFLNLPLKPLCRPECKGLCGSCGANRNRLECKCQTEDIDPRFAHLLELKKRMGNSD